MQTRDDSTLRTILIVGTLLAIIGLIVALIIWSQG